MALRTAQQIGQGTTPSFTTPASSDTVQADSGLFLEVKNTSGSAVTVTVVDAGKTPAGSSATNPSMSVPATTGDRMFALDPRYADPATGLITINYSATTSVTHAIFRL